MNKEKSDKLIINSEIAFESNLENYDKMVRKCEAKK